MGAWDNPPMHLVDVPSCYPPHRGGLELYAQEMHRHLLAADPDLRITVLTSELGATPGVEVVNDRYKIVRWKAWQPVSPYPVPKPGFMNLLRQHCAGPEKPVLMTHTRFFYHAALVSRFAQRNGLRRVHIEHGASPVESGNKLIRLVADTVDHTIARHVLGKADAVVAVSESAKTFVRDLSGVEAISVYRGMELPDGLRSEPVTEPPTLGFVGRLINGKGTADMLTAVAMLRDSGQVVQVRICGDGPARAALDEQVRELRLTDQVTFLGAVDHATALREIATCTVFVNPSWTEGLGGTVLEAAALGAAVVATEVGGVPEIVTNGETGWLVPPKEPATLADTLREALANPARRAEYGELLRKTTEQKFNWDNAVAVISALLRDLPVPTTA